MQVRKAHPIVSAVLSDQSPWSDSMSVLFPCFCLLVFVITSDKEEHLTSAVLPREKCWLSGLEHNPKTKQTLSKFYALTF